MAILIKSLNAYTLIIQQSNLNNVAFSLIISKSNPNHEARAILPVVPLARAAGSIKYLILIYMAMLP